VQTEKYTPLVSGDDPFLLLTQFFFINNDTKVNFIFSLFFKKIAPEKDIQHYILPYLDVLESNLNVSPIQILPAL